MSSSSPPRTHDVRVIDTSLIFSVITLTFSQPFHGSRTVFSLPDSLRDFYRSELYPACSSLSIAGIACIAAPTINASGCGRYTLHSPHRVWVLDLFACLLTDSSHLFLRAIQAWELILPYTEVIRMRCNYQLVTVLTWFKPTNYLVLVLFIRTNYLQLFIVSPYSLVAQHGSPPPRKWW